MYSFYGLYCVVDLIKWFFHTTVKPAEYFAIKALINTSYNLSISVNMAPLVKLAVNSKRVKKPLFYKNQLVLLNLYTLVEQVDILTSKNQALQILYLKYHS